MRILAIRGRNLASLSTEFCVDFTAEPLASAGLYAITGVTGSGKSTLLDALCLALYERTPRLARAGAQGESVPDVGESAVGPSDPRTILRRGAAEGFAEVDFVGCDSDRYRARWSVRRARNKAGGALQDSEMTLSRLADLQLLGDHRKRETLRLIEEKVGLSFAQFTRAVLLAQNDFAAFLKASADERAELLQTLTGTEMFTRISIDAFGRQKAENDALKLLNAQLADALPLPAEARATKTGELGAHEARARALEERRARIEAQLRWHDVAAKLAASEDEAAARLAAARLAREQANERSGNLARIEAAQPARALCFELARLGGEIDATAPAQRAQEALLEHAAKRVSESKDALAAATRALQATEETNKAAQPAIERARALDAQIVALTPSSQRALAAGDEARRLFAAASARHGALEKELVHRQRGLQAAQRWLVEQAPLRPLAEGWQRWETLFAQAAALADDERRAAARCRELAGEEGASARALTGASADHLDRLAADRAAAARLATRSQALAAFAPEEIARRKQAAEASREQLTSAREVCREVAEQGQRRHHLQAQNQECADALAVVQKEIARCAGERPLAERELASAEKMLRIAELATSENVEKLRAGLESECPCPVCGSPSHPYAGDDRQLGGALAALEAEVGRVRRHLTDIVRRESAASAQHDATRKRRAALDVELAALAMEMEANEQRFATHSLADALRQLSPAARAAWLEEKQATLQSTLNGLAREEAACREALRERDLAQDAASKAQTTLAAAAQALAALELAHQKIVQTGRAEQEKLVGLAQQLAAVLALLDVAFAGEHASRRWRERWHAERETFVAACRADAQAWTARQTEAAACSEKIGSLTTAIAAALDAVAAADRQLKARTEESERLARELQALQADRQTLFAGTSINKVEAALAQAIAAAKAALARQQESGQQAEVERSRLDEALRQNRGRLETLRDARARAQQALDAWLQGFNAGQDEGSALSADALGALLACSPEWIAAERQALHALDGAIDSARAVLEEHRKARAAHRATKPGDDAADASPAASCNPAETLRAALAQTIIDLDPVNALVAGLRIELACDDERRVKSQALLAERDRQAAKARVWSQLSELIGSADGKKFRNFAQQLTLDILLGYANCQLATLSRRYRLERITGSLGLLVVDQDMGDEVRSVHSLSGGESFLVSLALALGLASLSSHRVKVESLFIDEGFGSLDADSLAVALDALDSLQAQGRKVGVISHVPEMHERIGTRIEVRRLAGGHSRVVAA